MQLSQAIRQAITDVEQQAALHPVRAATVADNLTRLYVAYAQAVFESHNILVDLDSVVPYRSDFERLEAKSRRRQD